jgi:hypothetical protein
MKKTAKRAKSESSKRAMVKRKAKKTAKASTSSRSKKTAVRTPVSKLKKVAKKTATAAVVAAGVAALDTALGELKERKNRQGALQTIPGPRDDLALADEVIE